MSAAQVSSFISIIFKNYLIGNLNSKNKKIEPKIPLDDAEKPNAFFEAWWSAKNQQRCWT